MGNQWVGETNLIGQQDWDVGDCISTPTPALAAFQFSPLLGLHIHDQGDVALNEGEGEEADVATVIAGTQGVLHSGNTGAHGEVYIHDP